MAVPTRRRRGPAHRRADGVAARQAVAARPGIARPRLRRPRDHRSHAASRSSRASSIPTSSTRPGALRDAASGVLADTTGLDGESGHVLAFARANVPGWTVILDRPRSEVFAAARRTPPARARPARRRRAARPRPAALDLRARARPPPARARAGAPAAAALRAGAPGGDDAAAQPARRRARRSTPSTPLPATSRAAPASRSAATGSTSLRRPDGIVHVTVGDVAGHGVAAAALMGQLRNAFRAYAYEHVSPAELMSRLHRHVGPDEMATAVCISIDPYARELAYSSAGHPPPLLRDDETRARSRASIAPSRPCSRTSLRAAVSRGALCRCRGARRSWPTRTASSSGATGSSTRGSSGWQRRCARRIPRTSASELADALIRDVAEVTAADDDIALLVMRFADVPATSTSSWLDGAGRRRETRRRVHAVAARPRSGRERPRRGAAGHRRGVARQADPAGAVRPAPPGRGRRRRGARRPSTRAPLPRRAPPLSSYAKSELSRCSDEEPRHLRLVGARA